MTTTTKTRSHPRIDTRCRCGANLTARISAGHILYRHLVSSPRCRDLYIEAGQLTIVDTETRTLVITPTTHVQCKGSAQWEVVGLGVLGQRIRLGSYRTRTLADHEVAVLRGE